MLAEVSWSGDALLKLSNRIGVDRAVCCRLLDVALRKGEVLIRWHLLVIGFGSWVEQHPNRFAGCARGDAEKMKAVLLPKDNL